jgi:hypothetical protein
MLLKRIIYLASRIFSRGLKWVADWRTGVKPGPLSGVAQEAKCILRRSELFAARPGREPRRNGGRRYEHELPPRYS